MFLQLELMGYSIKKLLRAPECAAQNNQGGIEKNRNIGDHIRKGFGCGLNHLDSQYISRLRKSDDLPGSRGFPGSPGHSAPCFLHAFATRHPFQGARSQGGEWTARSARHLHISNFACAPSRSPVQHAIDENAGAYTLSDVQKHKMIFALGGAVGPFS